MVSLGTMTHISMPLDISVGGPLANKLLVVCRGTASIQLGNGNAVCAFAQTHRATVGQRGPARYRLRIQHAIQHP